jgi:succinate-semialdehyde dehydrogenase/glutarate-semialdehyde dehydrogenase
MAMKSINPCDGSEIRSYEEFGETTTDELIDRSARAFREWSRTSFEQRSDLMKRAAGILREKKEDYARLMSFEMGKPVSQGRAEAEKCAWVCDYYAENAESFLESVNVETDAVCSQVVFRPLGPVLAVMPWNFPFWQVFRFAAPGLMAGNTGLLKHASNVCGCALAIEGVFREAGFPDGAFRTLLLSSGRVPRVIADPRIRAVTLTGSTEAGRAVGRASGNALKKVVLELGGSDPYLVLEDADLEHAARTCVTARLINSGQSCIAGKRFIVVDAVYEPFRDLFVKGMKAARVGDPLEDSTLVGPMARSDLRDELHDQVTRSVEAGCSVALGGDILEGPGAFYPPTVLEDVVPGMPAFDEETFGPVAALVRAENEEEAIDLANRSVFGLGAAVFTSDTERGYRIAAEELQAGACFVNAFVRSDPRLPFGGVRESGFGRELSSFGIREFVNIKCVYVGEGGS